MTVEPDSPRDAIQAAFLQKQLAGKAPASSPRTSLWMNSAPLPAPCVLAPAAFATVESSKLHGNDQASPADRKVCFSFQHKINRPFVCGTQSWDLVRYEMFTLASSCHLHLSTV